MPRYPGMIFMISPRFFMEYWRALRVPLTNASTSAGIAFYFFIRQADAAIGIGGHVVAGIGDAVEAIALQHEISRRSDQRGGDSSGSKSEDRFFLSADNDDGHVLVGRQAVLLQYHLQHQVIGAAAG